MKEYIPIFALSSIACYDLNASGFDIRVGREFSSIRSSECTSSHAAIELGYTARNSFRVALGFLSRDRYETGSSLIAGEYFLSEDLGDWVGSWKKFSIDYTLKTEAVYTCVYAEKETESFRISIGIGPAFRKFRFTFLEPGWGAEISQRPQSIASDRTSFGGTFRSSLSCRFKRVDFGISLSGEYYLRPAYVDQLHIQFPIWHQRFNAVDHLSILSIQPYISYEF